MGKKILVPCLDVIVIALNLSINRTRSFFGSAWYATVLVAQASV